MPNVFFTSDQHFGHANILKYSKRPFKDITEMRESLISNYNAVVKPGDVVYHLGDFAFCNAEEAVKIVRRLQGNRFLIWGNHDKALKKDAAFMAQWIWAKDMADITVEGQRIVLCHYAMLTWNQSHRGAWQLHGHSHGSLKEDPRALRVDVGVDVWGYTPVSFAALKNHMSKKSYQPIDHHGQRGEDEE